MTYILGLGKGGAERALIEAVRVRADRRGGGIGRILMERTIERARTRGCALVQLTSNKRREDAHRFYGGLGFARSHDGFKLALQHPAPVTGAGGRRLWSQMIALRRWSAAR
ncbi:MULTISPECIES: GNAT family N-acetyltransferase [unclassified Streptomyces]|uniref:GNAT family N-acetyltransferase n=1 Tax=unclassified Streptomyces TaxID=2593676 RepID=UPI003656AA15